MNANTAAQVSSRRSMAKSAMQIVAKHIARAGVFAAALFLVVTSDSPIVAAPPDPIALLHGVEQSRLGLESGRVVLKTIAGPDGMDASPIDLTIEFNKDRRTIIQKNTVIILSSDENMKYVKQQGGTRIPSGVGVKKKQETRLAWDGTQLCRYGVGTSDADYRKTAGGTADLAFDPRLIGITFFYSVNETLRDALCLDTIRKAVPVEKNVINGISVWHVSIVDVNGGLFEYWIQDEANFRVHKVKYSSPDNSRVYNIDSRFSDDERSILPKEVIVKIRSKAGRGATTVKMIVTEATIGTPVSSDIGTIASLGLPVGTRVNDNRTSKHLGYWTGSGLSPDQANDASANAGGVGRFSRGRIVAMAAMAAIAIAVVALVLRRRVMAASK